MMSPIIDVIYLVQKHHRIQIKNKTKSVRNHPIRRYSKSQDVELANKQIIIQMKNKLTDHQKNIVYLKNVSFMLLFYY